MGSCIHSQGDYFEGVAARIDLVRELSDSTLSNTLLVC
jgi:hypothetical protein